MKRFAFTMIEIIFVIVILGILAAVAIPRIAASRDDAKASKAATNVAVYITDIGAYYTSKGALDLSASSVVLSNDGCFTAVSSGNGAIVISANGLSATGNICTRAASIASVAGSIHTHDFSGIGAAY